MKNLTGSRTRSKLLFLRCHPPDPESGVEHSSSSTPEWRTCPPIVATFKKATC